MKKFLAMLLALMMVLSLCACGSKPAAEAPAADAPATEADPADDFYLEIKFSNVFQPTEWNYKASEKLAEMITERTEGHITVTYYGQNELDCYGDSVTRAVNGENWMGLEEPSLFADYAGDAAMVIAPMLYSSNAEYNYVMDSDFVANLIDELAAQGTRFRQARNWRSLRAANRRSRDACQAKVPPVSRLGRAPRWQRDL